MMRRFASVLLVMAPALLPGVAVAAGWAPSGCGDAPGAPHYDLATRDGYNASVAKANAYQAVAKAYAACVLKDAHEDQTAISRAAQNKIADIQATAVAMQQDIYARLAAQAAMFKAAAAKLKAQN